MRERVLGIVAHSDDEALGFGGALARHAAIGDHVSLLIIADGVSSRGAGAAEESSRVSASQVAGAVLGVQRVINLGLPDNRLDSVPLLDVVKKIEAVLSDLGPTIIYTHHYGDLNVDHRVVHQAVMTACRPMPGSSVREILTCEILSSTEWSAPEFAPFLPNVFIDISEHIETKMKALEAYEVEMRRAPHSRSFEHVRSLATHRGHSAGVVAAEAFMLVRAIR